MKKEKRIVLVILSLVLSLSLLSCKKVEKEALAVTVPQGAPLMALAGVADDLVTLSVVSGAAPLQAALTEGSADVVAAPLALGAKLYLKGSFKYRLRAIITFDNTYLVTREGTSLSNLEDVAGKTILAYGAGTAPDAILQGALASASVSTTIDYVNAVSDVAAPFASGKYDVALLAEPVISTLEVKKGLKLSTLSLPSLLSSEVASFPQAALFVKEGLSAGQEKEAEIYLSEVKSAITRAIDDPKSYAASIVGKDEYFSTTLGETVLATTLPRIGLGFTTGNEARSLIKSYASFVNGFSQTILGGTPDDDFVRE